ncbi:MAG: ATP-binding protein [Rhodospirillales bacterium]|nr:ATP-binding protein [Rhodospirillales bacterium]
MIHSIEIENYFGIRDKQKLDFRVAKNVPILNVFRDPKSKIGGRIPTAIGIFGANASGKTTVLRALSSLVRAILHSFDLQPNQSIPLMMPFEHNDWKTRPTRFVIEFDALWDNFEEEFKLAQQEHRPAKCDLYRYEAEISHQVGKTGIAFQSERLFVTRHAGSRTQPVFIREHGTFTSAKGLGIKPSDDILKRIRDNASTISTLAKFNVPFAVNAWNSISLVESNVVISREEYNANAVFQWYGQNPSALTALNAELQRLDFGLREMRIYQAEKGPSAIFFHDGLENPIDFFFESLGTRNFVSQFSMAQRTLTTGGISLFDELTNSLHQSIVSEILGWFADCERNPFNAQIIFTTHDVALLNELEKEQIIITEKSSDGAVEMFLLKDLQGVRREPNLMPKYLSGTFGGLPRIG